MNFHDTDTMAVGEEVFLPSSLRNDEKTTNTTSIKRGHRQSKRKYELIFTYRFGFERCSPTCEENCEARVLVLRLLRLTAANWLLVQKKCDSSVSFPTTESSRKNKRLHRATANNPLNPKNEVPPKTQKILLTYIPNESHHTVCLYCTRSMFAIFSFINTTMDLTQLALKQ
jgi:hypothetical protein